VRSLVAGAVAAPWVVWAVVRTLGVELPYPFVALLAFTPYAALSSWVPVAVGVIVRRWVVVGVAGVAMLAFAAALVPRAVAGPDTDAQGPRLVVMTANVWLGHADPRALLRIAREHDVDVLSLQELRPEQMAKLDRVGAKATFPYRSVEPGEGASGTGVLSRLPVLATDTTPDITGHAEPEVLLDVRGAPPVRLKAVHPAPPVNSVAAPRWQDALAALPGSDGRGDVRILAGDFNATLDHVELRRLLGRGYIDAADAAGKGWIWTWPALPRRALPITIDHILVDERVEVEDVVVVRVPRSDHRAVIATLRLPKG
jgi:endonuclease/exonuclease/phosphatase (EEP) superfamily protein YafD